MPELLMQYQRGLIAAAATLFIFYIIRAVLVARIQAYSKKTENDFDDFITRLIMSLKFIFGITLAVIVGFAVEGLPLNTISWLSSVVTIVVTYQVAKAAGILFKYIVNKTDAHGGAQSVQGLTTVLKIVIWISGFAFVLAQLGYNITSIVAGLGIGGVAVALALQSILSDVFSSFSIYFDKPFVVGDVIMVNDLVGTVERIGIKTTRIRSLGGEEIVVSNKILTDSSLHNYGEMHRRRVVHVIGFEYGTPSEKLEAFCDEVGEMIEEQEGVTFDRCHFKQFGDSALIHELVYFAETPDYAEYTRLEHAVNMKIKEYCEKNELGMAYPTQTVLVRNT